MIFELGKFYRHNAGEEVAIVGKVMTTLYGEILVGESSRGGLNPIGIGEIFTVNWTEITKDEWMRNFN